MDLRDEDREETAAGAGRGEERTLQERRYKREVVEVKAGQTSCTVPAQTSLCRPIRGRGPYSSPGQHTENPLKQR